MYFSASYFSLSSIPKEVISVHSLFSGVYFYFIFFSVFRGPAPLISKAVASTLDVSLSLVISVYIQWCPTALQQVSHSFSAQVHWFLLSEFVKSKALDWSGEESPLCAWTARQLHLLPASASDACLIRELKEV